MSFDIDPTDVIDSCTGSRVYVLNIQGTAFLWHQVSSLFGTTMSYLIIPLPLYQSRMDQSRMVTRLF